MVKNKKGGNKGKKVARKHVRNHGYNKKIRLSENDEELYAIVQKVNGNCCYDVLCNDKIVRKLQLRRKFCGRNKRDNFITLKTIVLIGIREWEVTTKMPKVDCLYVYNECQHKELFDKEGEKLIDNIKFISIKENFKKKEEDKNDIGIDFENNNNEYINQLDLTDNNTLNEKIDDINNDNTFNWEDI